MSEQQPMGTVSYQYDAYGKRTRLTWPDAFYVTYGYNEGDELTKICESGGNCTSPAVPVFATTSYSPNGLNQIARVHGEK